MNSVLIQESIALTFILYMGKNNSIWGGLKPLMAG